MVQELASHPADQKVDVAVQWVAISRSFDNRSGEGSRDKKARHKQQSTAEEHYGKKIDLPG
jgi:hypothetical protein